MKSFLLVSLQALFLLSSVIANAQPVCSFEEALKYGETKLKELKQENVAQPMQYVVLTSSASFEKQVQVPFTVYEIKHLFDLGGNTVSIPERCVLVFNGGALKNGRLIGNNTQYCSKVTSSVFQNCEVDGTMEKIGFVVKASERKMAANDEECSKDNYKALCSLIRKGENLFLDGKYYISFSNPVVLNRTFRIYGGELVYGKNAFGFSNNGGLVVQGSSIVVSEKTPNSFFCGSKKLLGAISISKIEFVHCLIDCRYLVNVFYEDLNSDLVPFGVKQVEVDHCDIKQTGRVRIRNAVISERCSITHNYYHRITTTPIFICCNHSVQSSPNDEHAYKYVFQNLLKGCPIVIDHNVFVGTPVSLSSYYCAALIKSVDCFFTNNYIEDIINYSDGSGATAYDAYLSCANVYYENNFVKDVMSFSKGKTKKPLCQIGKSKTNTLSYIKIPAKRWYKNNVFIVDGDRFLNMGADISSLYADIFANRSYISDYIWEGNAVVFNKARLRIGKAGKSYRSFQLLNNYFEVDEVVGVGLIKVRTDQKLENILVQGNTFKLGKNQCFPILYQKYYEDYKREDQKHIVITDNTFYNCVPKVRFYTGEQVIIKNNLCRVCGVSNNLNMSKNDNFGVLLDVKDMDVELCFGNQSESIGDFVQYFSSDSRGRYSIEIDDVPDKGISYYYTLKQDHRFRSVLEVIEDQSTQIVRIPFQYEGGLLSYEWEGESITVSVGITDSMVWYDRNGIQMKTSFFHDGKNQFVTQLTQFDQSSKGGVKYKFIYESGY